MGRRLALSTHRNRGFGSSTPSNQNKKLRKALVAATLAKGTREQIQLLLLALVANTIARDPTILVTSRLFDFKSILRSMRCRCSVIFLGSNMT